MQVERNSTALKGFMSHHLSPLLNSSVNLSKESSPIQPLNCEFYQSFPLVKIIKTLFQIKMQKFLAPEISVPDSSWNSLGKKIVCVLLVKRCNRTPRLRVLVIYFLSDAASTPWDGETGISSGLAPWNSAWCPGIIATYKPDIGSQPCQHAGI